MRVVDAAERPPPFPAIARSPRASRDLRGNRLYTLLPGRTGRASGHSLYSRRVRHPSRESIGEHVADAGNT
ncbi:hypothetical protein CFB46_18840 [Burkholderia sp. HI2761]|nr:hypothetical protein [Burkholderia sp. BE24]OXJ23004.1 hypothetical protein CFB46_18840 [Burkholderia sp. HI2761]